MQNEAADLLAFRCAPRHCAVALRLLGCTNVLANPRGSFTQDRLRQSYSEAGGFYLCNVVGHCHRGYASSRI